MTSTSRRLPVVLGLALLACVAISFVVTSEGAFAGEPEAVMVGAGDIAECDDGTPAAPGVATAKLVESIPGTVFTLGDNAYLRGTAEEYAGCYAPTWGRFFSRTKPAVGNHEYMTPGAAGYYGYFGERAGPAGRGYYSYDLGESWHIVVLNSNCRELGGCGVDSAQVAWLKQDLATHTRPCTLAYFHHPRFSSGRHGDDTDSRVMWQVLYDHGAELVLSGHDHHYERFAPQDADGKIDRKKGLRQFVVGTGGRRLYQLRPDGPMNAHTEVRNNDTFGVLKLSLFGGGYAWEFLPAKVPGSASGQPRPFTDGGMDRCH